MDQVNSGEAAGALTRAIRTGDIAATRQLLSEHADLRRDLNAPMHDAHFGGTALLAAVRAGHRALVDVLLEAGADINQKSHWWAGGFGVLDGESPLVPYLVDRGAEVNAYAAARHGMREALARILDMVPGAARMRGGDGQTPLHVAASVEIAELLLAHGAELDALDVDHESTPAMYLVRERPQVAKYLIGRGCRTDILMAAAIGDRALVRRHLERDPGAIRMAVTPEYFPMQDPRAGGTIYIWTLGADMIPHTVAHRAGQREVFGDLMAVSSPALQVAVACEIGDEARARRLLASHPDVIWSLTSTERRRLAAAAMADRLDAVRLMLALGWPTDEPGKEGGTALHWAAFHGNAEMVRTLLVRNPDRTIRDTSHGGTALDWARYGKEHCGGSGDYETAIGLLKG